MAIDIGPRIGVDGEAEFRRSIQNINQQVKTLKSEMQAAASQFDKSSTAEEKNAKTTELLGKQITAQREKISLLEEGLEKSRQKYGENDAATLKWRQAVADATTALGSMERQLDEVGREVEDVSGEMRDGEKSTTGWADVLKGSLLSSAIVGGVKMLGSAIKSAAGYAKGAVSDAVELGDAVDKQSQKLGISRTEYQQLSYALDKYAVDVDNLQTSLKTLSTNAQNNAEAFNALGLSQEFVRSASTEELFEATVKSLQGMAEGTERTTIATKLLGKSATDLAPLLNDTNANFQALKNSAPIMSDATVDAAAQMSDAMADLRQTMTGIKTNVVGRVLKSLVKAVGSAKKAVAKPEVSTALEKLGKGIGKTVETVVDVASSVLPYVVKGIESVVSALKWCTDALGITHRELRDYTDAERDSIERAAEAAEAYRDLGSTIADNAAAVSENSKRTGELWRELKGMTDASGNVADADRARAEVILNELNEALGTEYEITGNQIARYGEMVSTIEDVIKAKQAEALLSTYEEQYTAALEARNDAVENALIKQEDLATAQKNAADAQARYDALMSTNGEEYSNYTNYVEDLGAAEAEREKTLNALTGAQEAYNEAERQAGEYYADIAKYEEAQSALMEGNYQRTAEILTGSSTAMWSALDDRKRLSEEEQAQLERDYKHAVDRMKWYEQQYKDGAAGITKAVVEESQREAFELARIWNQQKSDAKIAGENLVDGIANGMGGKRSYLEQKSRDIMRGALNAMRNEAGIASPSKVTTRFGEFLGEGLMRGMDRSSIGAERSAADLMGGILGQLHGAASMSPVVAGAGASYSTNVGGITLNVSGAGVPNVEALADLVSDRLYRAIINRRAGG